MFSRLLYTVGVYILLLMCTCSELEDMLSQDPSLWPGHMEAFGSKQKTVEVDQIFQWPDPITFFTEYVEGNKPVLFKGLAKQSPGFRLFDDNYLKSFYGSDQEMVYAEKEKKENRTKKGFTTSFKDFIERYHSENLYMVNPLPRMLQKDVLMPAPLRCEETRKLMSSQVTWFSSGGTKSVLHNDDVDNINCLFRGTKELFFIEYTRNKRFVPIDQPQGGYSSLDVDKVNYTTYPALRYVDEYVHATMEEGDCVFIPYHWFHQVNSKENERGQNLAVNVWFTHVHGHQPSNCTLTESQATLDKYVFPDDEKDRQERGESDEEEERVEDKEDEPPIIINHFLEYLQKTKHKVVHFKTFLILLKKDSMINPGRFQIQDNPKEFQELGAEIFALLDIIKNGILNIEDFDEWKSLWENKKTDVLNTEKALSKSVARVEDYFEDLVEDFYREATRQQRRMKTDVTEDTKSSEKSEL